MHKLIQESSVKWGTCKSGKDTNLLRLIILRDLICEIHAKRSTFLAEGAISDASRLEQLEPHIQALASKDLSNDNLDGLLTDPNSAPDSNRILPVELFSSIPHEKFDRHDRKWEMAITAEALKAGWTIWTLDMVIQIFKADEFQRSFTQLIWPEAAVLFVEGLPLTNPDPLIDAQGRALWLGRWFCCVKNRKFIETINFESMSGVSPDMLEKMAFPLWNCIFSPKLPQAIL